MIYYYRLQIEAPIEKKEEVERIMGTRSNYPTEGWGLQLVERKGDKSISFVSYFVSLLQGKYAELETVGMEHF